MKLSLANGKAIKYACENFHYAGKQPAVVKKAYNIYNDSNDWCGCIVYNYPKGKHIANRMTDCYELIRVALNGKQEQTSKAVSMTIKDIKKNNPEIKLLISYADTDQGHNGTIYQATNWYYIDKRKTGDCYQDPKTGKLYHARVLSNTGLKKQFGRVVRVKTMDSMTRIKKGYKHLYYYPLTKELKEVCEQIKKPYPKKDIVVTEVIDGTG